MMVNYKTASKVEVKVELNSNLLYIAGMQVFYCRKDSVCQIPNCQQCFFANLHRPTHVQLSIQVE